MMDFRGKLNRWWIKRPVPEQSPQAEAERLVGLWGEAAYDVARSLSLREGAGLLHTATPGFWARVVREVGQKLGISQDPVYTSDLLAR